MRLLSKLLSADAMRRLAIGARCARRIGALPTRSCDGSRRHDLRERPWRFLSQGERQRVLIGRALMASPRLMILDEPCAGLDPVAREHFLQFIQRIARVRGAPTMVLVTHHVEEIVPIFSHVLVLKSGRVLAAGPRARVLTSATLSDAFAAPVRLTRARGRYSLYGASSSRNSHLT